MTTSDKPKRTITKLLHHREEVGRRRGVERADRCVVTSDMDVSTTWTDELNNALHPFGFLLSGEEAGEIFGALLNRSGLEKMRSVTEAEIAEMVDRANEYCDTDKIEASHIRAAIEGTLWHWDGDKRVE